MPDTFIVNVPLFTLEAVVAVAALPEMLPLIVLDTVRFVRVAVVI